MSAMHESVVSPVGGESVRRRSLAPRLDTLAGKTIGEVWNEDFKGDIMFPVYRELLRARYPGVKIVPWTEFPRAVLKGTPAYQREVVDGIARFARERGCDALVSGNGG